MSLVSTSFDMKKPMNGSEERYALPCRRWLNQGKELVFGSSLQFLPLHMYMDEAPNLTYLRAFVTISHQQTRARLDSERGPGHFICLRLLSLFLHTYSRPYLRSIDKAVRVVGSIPLLYPSSNGSPQLSTYPNGC